MHRAPRGIAYRKIAEKSSIAPVEVDYVPVSRGMQLQAHLHRKSNAFCIILEGSGTVMLGKKTRKVRKADTIDIPAGTWHSFKASKKTGMVFLSIQYPPIKEDYLFGASKR